MNDAQVAKIVAYAFPGNKLRNVEPMGKRTTLLTLGDQRRVVLRQTAPPDEWAGEPLAAEAGALLALRGEIDLPLPELLAYEPEGEPVGEPYALLSYMEGKSLPEVNAGLSEDQRYQIGRRLGAVMLRIHSYTVPDYGLLPPEADAWSRAAPQPPPEPQKRSRSARHSEPVRRFHANNTADLEYLTGRLTHALDMALHNGELDENDHQRIFEWLQTKVTSYGQAASMVHGDLRPERVLLRRRDRSWQISGLVGWGYALAWRPGWDHAVLLESSAGTDYFSFRVGYGNAYDDVAERGYDQLRHLALLPYRLTLYLEAGRADLALGLVNAATEAERKGRIDAEPPED